MKLHLVSLGCARNSIDSEMMQGLLAKSGWSIEDEPDEAEVIIINTCSFIESAINESVDTILELSEYKKKGACKNLIVAGCLPERFREKIIETLPEVDYFVGTGAFEEIVQFVEKSARIPRCYLPDPSYVQFQGHEKHIRPILSHSAYVKVAEGCDRHCTYCIIPKLRGKQRSRPLNEIVEEAIFLATSGVKELILVAQDTTSYGKDLYPQKTIVHLLGEIANISDNIWVRILYGHPESVDESFIKTVGSHKNICSYFVKRLGQVFRKRPFGQL
jgi:ribosomal protein S12 methylthiotransferase